MNAIGSVSDAGWGNDGSRQQKRKAAEGDEIPVSERGERDRCAETGEETTGVRGI